MDMAVDMTECSAIAPDRKTTRVATVRCQRFIGQSTTFTAGHRASLLAAHARVLHLGQTYSDRGQTKRPKSAVIIEIDRGGRLAGAGSAQSARRGRRGGRAGLACSERREGEE